MGLLPTGERAGENSDATAERESQPGFIFAVDFAARGVNPGRFTGSTRPSLNSW